MESTIIFLLKEEALRPLLQSLMKRFEILLYSTVLMGCGVSAFSGLGRGGRSSVTRLASEEGTSKGSLSPFTSPMAYAVLNWGFTEPRFSSRYNYSKDNGTFTCKKCGNELYRSDDKYDSGSGWPSFTSAVVEGESSNVEKKPRDATGRFEIVCKCCGGHLGHVFPDGPSKAKGGTGWRHCVNGAALDFSKKTSDE